MSVKNYKDYSYTRAPVLDADIKDVIMGELGLDESDMVDGLIFDGKVIPVVSLNARSMCYWIQEELAIAAGGHEHMHMWGNYDLMIDAAGEVTLEHYVHGSWYEFAHLGGASPDYITNVKSFGTDNTRIVGVAANSTVRYIGMVFASALVPI